MTARLLFVHALSPLHAGTGQSVGAIELSIARDRATRMPLVPGSSIKGALKDRATDANLRSALFGPDNGSEHAGALVFGDANLLCLPVRSIAGTFAWATSPLLLARYARDCGETGVAAPPVPSPTVITQILLPPEGSVLKCQVNGQQRVVFEDLDFVPHNDGQVANVAKHIADLVFPGEAQASWNAMFKTRFCVVHDQVMSFLAEHATDVVARVALKDDTKTVDNLWHEESLPVESILVSLVDALPHPALTQRLGGAKTRTQLLVELGRIIGNEGRGVVQLGGKSTVGRGRCRVVLGGAP